MKKIIGFVLCACLLCGCANSHEEQESQNMNVIECKEGNIEIDFIDNGCEALSITVLKPDWNDQELNLEGVYAITSYENQDDQIVITCICGDYYSHENARDFKILIEDGLLSIEK